MQNTTLTNPSNNCRDDCGHKLRRGKREGRIRIMFQNIIGIGNILDQDSQRKLYNFKKTMINEGIAVVGIAEVNSNWSKIPIK